MLSEISQTGKGEHCMASFLCSKKKKNQTHRNREQNGGCQGLEGG